MRLANPLGLLLSFAAFAGAATAADNASVPAAAGQLRIPITETGAASHGDADAPMILRVGPREQGLDMSPFADVCFNVRTYKVKPTERLRDGELGLRGYTTCQMGSDYKVRTAGHSPARLK